MSKNGTCVKNENAVVLNLNFIELNQLSPCPLDYSCENATHPAKGQHLKKSIKLTHLNNKWKLHSGI